MSVAVTLRSSAGLFGSQRTYGVLKFVDFIAARFHHARSQPHCTVAVEKNIAECLFILDLTLMAKEGNTARLFCASQAGPSSPRPYCRVRLVKVIRNRDGTQDIVQYSVQILLEGDIMDTSFTEGDNKNVVPTDTCKNTVYCVANQHNFNSPEEFGILLCKHFIAEYPDIVNRISVKIVKDRWERLQAPNSSGKIGPHKHAFKRLGPSKPFANVQAEKRKGVKICVQAGFRGFDIMKTTQSGFTDFHTDKFTSLPPSTDRLLGTSVDAEWAYSSAAILRGGIDFNKVCSFGV
jgi:urate oxidase